MPKIKFSVSPSLESVARPFRNYRSQFIDDKLNDLTKMIHNNIIDEAPVRSGQLRGAIIRRKYGIMNYDILVDYRMRGSKYEPFVRLGVRPERRNPILPRRKKALYWPGALHPVKAVYNHLGMKANPYWDRGIRRSEGDIKRAEELIGSDIETELIK